MKRHFLFFSALMSFACASALDFVIGIETTIPNQGSYVTGYDKEFKLSAPGSSLSWTARNFNNNNSAWNNIRCGSKSAATTATVTTDFAIEAEICSVDVELTRYKAGSSNRMTSMALLVSPNADMSAPTTYNADISSLPSTTGSSVIISIPVETPAANLYYQLLIEMPKVSSEGVFSVNSINYYKESQSAAEGTHEMVIDFTDYASVHQSYTGAKAIASGSEYAESGSNNLDGATFKSGPVEVVLSKASGTIQPRWWESATIYPELRLNPDNTLTFSVVDDGYRLQEVKFFRGNANQSYFNALKASAVTNIGTSDFENQTWTAPETGIVNRLQLTIGEDYCRCGSIQITYMEDDSAVAGLDITEEELYACPTEYFDLRGLPVGTDNPAPGIYIRRQGGNTSKILIR